MDGALFCSLKNVSKANVSLKVSSGVLLTAFPCESMTGSGCDGQ